MATQTFDFDATPSTFEFYVEEYVAASDVDAMDRADHWRGLGQAFIGDESQWDLAVETMRARRPMVVGVSF